MTKFEEMKNRMEVLSEVYETLERNYNNYLEWGTNEDGTMNDYYSRRCDVYMEVMKLLEKTYLK